MLVFRPSITRVALACLLLPVLSLPVCAAGPLVAVAANFAGPMQAIADAWEQQSGVKPVISLGSSGKFYAQIRQGAPFELFLSADQAKPIALEENGLIVPGSRFTYAEGNLVLWSGRLDVLDSSILQSPAVKRIAIANPRLAPYGAAAEQVLRQLDPEAALRSRWVIGENIAQTFLFADSGNAELGFVATSQVMRDGRLIRGSGWPVPATLHDPILQDAVLLRRGGDNPQAVSLLAFLKTKTAGEIMQQYGYRPGAAP